MIRINMTVTSGKCVVLGAVLGIAAAFLVPCFKPDERKIKTQKKDKSRDGKVDVGERIKALTDILNMLEAELVNLYSKKKENDLPTEKETSKDSSSIFQDARSHITNISNQNAPSGASLEEVDSDDSTVYNQYTGQSDKRNGVKNRKLQRALSNFCKGMKRSNAFQKCDGNDVLPRQSTFINTKKIRMIPVGEKTIKEFEKLAAGDNNVPPKNIDIEISITPGEHSINSLFNKIKNALRFTKKSKDSKREFTNLNARIVNDSNNNVVES